MLLFNDGKHIVSIIGRNTCSKHKADIGEACYTIPSGVVTNKVMIGVCNKRAVKAGANGKVSETSLSRGERKSVSRKAS